MPEPQKDPDLLLAILRRDQAREKRGRLKVFLGMCPGVGKTYAMLEAARRELGTGKDVIVGYVETHGRRETDALAEGIPAVPRRATEYRGVIMPEMDLDAVLARAPRLAIVDELAHTNVPGSRHPKRWQDVQELLDRGIDVFTTLNVQHVESRADTVRQITGTEIRETVPDSILDEAVIRLVDLPPAELVQRLHEGKIYLPPTARAASENFFRLSNLTALRELALRLVADHVGDDTAEFRRSDPIAGPWKTGNRLLVAVGPSPLSEPLIRWTRRMADELRCRWLAVHVDGPRPLPESAEERLVQNLDTARELGAEVLTTTDEDLVRGLLRIARERNVTQIIVGKPGGTDLPGRLRSARLFRRLLEQSGDIDLHLIRAGGTEVESPGRTKSFDWNFNEYVFAAGVIGVASLVNLGLMALAGPRVPGMVFLLTVVLLALFVGRGAVFMAGALSAVIWNFFFLPPRFTFVISRAEDGMLFITYFVVSIVLGQLVARIRAQGEAERKREERATAISELSRELAEAGSLDEVVWQLLGQISRVFRASASVTVPVGDKLMTHPDSTLSMSEKEFSVTDWSFRNRKPAGHFTDNLPGAEALHLPLMTERKTMGVLAVHLPGANLPIGQRDLLETFARHAALVLDRIELRNAAEKAHVLAESERLGRTLLDSISHELRTPLAASTGAASALAAAKDAPIEQRQELLAEIQEANARLNRIVGNLLDVTRLESGQVRPRHDWHDARDLIQTTLRELHLDQENRLVTLDLPPQPLLVRLDFSLIQHALANLLLNAVAHTPAGSAIQVSARLADEQLTLSVADRGPGIPVALLPRIFEKFYRVPGTPAGGSGLGLTIAKGFVEAHAGSITVANRPGGGAVFTLILPRRDKPSEVEPG